MPVVLLPESTESAGGVEAARAVAKERTESGGRVVAARGVVLKCAYPQTGVSLRRSNPRQRERENNRSNAIRMEKNEAVLVDWLNISKPSSCI
jgi:hypothetical protein